MSPCAPLSCVTVSIRTRYIWGPFWTWWLFLYSIHKPNLLSRRHARIHSPQTSLFNIKKPVRSALFGQILLQTKPCLYTIYSGYSPCTCIWCVLDNNHTATEPSLPRTRREHSRMSRHKQQAGKRLRSLQTLLWRQILNKHESRSACYYSVRFGQCNQHTRQHDDRPSTLKCALRCHANSIYC